MDSQSLRFLSVNIEGHRHLDLVQPFLHTYQPEVICFQEIYEDTFHQFLQAFSLNGHWVPVTESLDEPGEKGSAIMSIFPLTTYTQTEFDNFQEINPEHIGKLAYRPHLWLQVAEVEKEGQVYRIGNCHFTWTNNGAVSDEQRVNLKTLLELTKQYEELVLAGDFNAPRGKEIFDTLAQNFKDNIPAEVTTTLDGVRHRAGHLEYVVDGVFSRGYIVKNVQVRDGLSDHCGITADIIKV